jgi:hypothetical protein
MDCVTSHTSPSQKLASENFFVVHSMSYWPTAYAIGRMRALGAIGAQDRRCRAALDRRLRDCFAAGVAVEAGACLPQ